MHALTVRAARFVLEEYPRVSEYELFEDARTRLVMAARDTLIHLLATRLKVCSKAIADELGGRSVQYVSSALRRHKDRMLEPEHHVKVLRIERKLENLLKMPAA